MLIRLIMVSLFTIYGEDGDSPSLLCGDKRRSTLEYRVKTMTCTKKHTSTRELKLLEEDSRYISE